MLEKIKIHSKWKGTVQRNSEERNPPWEFQRAVTGASLADRTAKRSRKPEVRKAQREPGVEAEEAKCASEKTAVAVMKLAPKQRIGKPVKVSAP